MNEDKYLDELFSSAKNQNNLLSDSEINSILENADVPSVSFIKKYFGVNKMRAIFYTAAAVVIGYFGIINLNNDDIINNEKPIEINLTESQNDDLSPNNQTTNEEMPTKSEEKVNTYEKEGPREVEKGEDLALGEVEEKKKAFPKKEEVIEYKSFNVIKLDEEDLKNLGVVVDGKKIKFSFDEKEDKAMVVTLMQNASFNIDNGKPLKSVTPKFVSGKNGIKIMSFFDNKNTMVYRTSKVVNDGERHVTTVLKRNAEEDYLDIKFDVDKSKVISSKRDSIIIYDPITLDKMLIKKVDPDIDRDMVIDIHDVSQDFPQLTSYNENSATFTFNEGTIFSEDSSPKLDKLTTRLIIENANNNSSTYSFKDDNIIVNDNRNSDSNTSNMRIMKRLDVVNVEGVKDKYLMADEDGDLVWTAKEPNANFVMVKKTGKDGKKTETRIENKIVKIKENQMNIDSILSEHNIKIDNLQEKIDNKMVVIQRSIEESNKKIEAANAKALEAHLKSMAIQESVENYFNHDINKLIPVEIKFDGVNLDYVLWFEPSMELLDRLPSRLQSKLRSEFEILQSEDGAYCGEAPIQNPISDKWNGCNGAIMNLKLSPIPAQSELNYSFELNDSRNLDVSITDINGMKLNVNVPKENYSVGSYLKKLDISSLSPGIYYLTIVSGNGEIVNQRFIKE